MKNESKNESKKENEAAEVKVVVCDNIDIISTSPDDENETDIRFY